MIKTCKCGREFITEADPYAVIPTKKGITFNCGCYFKENKKEVRQFVIVKRLLQIAYTQLSGMAIIKKSLDINSENDWLEDWIEEYKKL